MDHLVEATKKVSCPFFNIDTILSQEDMELLHRNKTEKSYLSNDIILRQGSYISQVLFLKSGLVKIILEDKDEVSSILKIVPHNNFIALPVLGNLNVYPFTVIAINKSVICHIRRDTLLDIIARNPELYNYIINWFAHDYTYLYDRFNTLSARNNHGKLASALLYLTGETFMGLNMLRLISRKELAQLASISLESTNRILLELKNDRIINIENRNITILEPKLLKVLSQVG